jgi:hypothetical protein
MLDEMADFAGDRAKVKAEGERKAIVIETLEGTMIGEPGDWIIRGVNGEFYPCKPDIFAKTYEPFESGAAQEVSPPSPKR